MVESMRRLASAMAPRALLLALLILILILMGACGSSYPAPDETQSKSRAPAEAAADGAESDPDSSGRKSWRWKGTRDQCFYLVGNECFSDRDAACQAAGCAASDCSTDSKAPASVSCD
jgi:hypothetical protein